MKRYKTANGICFFSLLFLLFSLWLKEGSPWQGTYWADLVYFMAQSCCIGCAADFIAVEALFRKHFLPIKPLVPANRDRIIQKVVEMNQSLLSPKNLLAKISRLSLMDFMSSMAYQSQRIYFSNIGSEGSHLCSGISV